MAEKLRHGFGVYLKPAAFQGRLVFASNEGRNVRFTHPPVAPADDPTAALAEVVRRYLGVYGPATREDLARWWGVSPAEGGRLLKSLGDAVESVEVDGVSAFVLAGAIEEMAAAEPRRAVRLLPAFDPLVVGATRAGLVTPVADRDAVYRKQAWISAVICVDGRMAGVWRHERRGATVEVELEPFGALPAWARTQAEAEAERVAAFLGGTLALRWNA